MLSTFIKLPFAIKIFALSIFEWPLKTGFTVLQTLQTVWTKIRTNKTLSRYLTLGCCSRKIFF